MRMRCACRKHGGRKLRDGCAFFVRLDHMRVSDWERGVCSPSMGNLAALAMLTGKTMAWFYTDHDAKAAA